MRGDAPIYLVEETIDLSDLSTLMISSQQRDVPWKLELQAEQQTQSFDRIMPSIDEVPIKDVRVRLARQPVRLEDRQQVIKLAMYITADL